MSVEAPKGVPNRFTRLSQGSQTREAQINRAKAHATKQKTSTEAQASSTMLSKPTLEDRVINVITRVAEPAPVAAGVGIGMVIGAALHGDVPVIVQELPQDIAQARDQMALKINQTWNVADSLAGMKKSNPGVAEAAQTPSTEQRRSTEFAPVGDIKKAGSDLVTVVQKADGTKAVASNLTYANGIINVQVEKNLSAGFSPTTISKNGDTEVVAGGTTVQYRTGNGDFQQVTVPGVQSIKDISVGPDGIATLAVVTADGHIHVDTLNTTTGVVRDANTGIAAGNSTSRVGMDKITDGTTVGSSKVMRGFSGEAGGFVVVTRDSAGNISAQQKEVATEGILSAQMEFTNSSGQVEHWVVNDQSTLGKVHVNINDSKVKTFTPDTTKSEYGGTTFIPISAIAGSTVRGEGYMATYTFSGNDVVSHIEEVSLSTPENTATRRLLTTTGLPAGVITSLQAQEASGTTLLLATVNNKLYGKNAGDSSNWQEVGLVENQGNTYHTYIPLGLKNNRP